MNLYLLVAWMQISQCAVDFSWNKQDITQTYFNLNTKNKRLFSIVISPLCVNSEWWASDPAYTKCVSIKELNVLPAQSFDITETKKEILQ